MNTKTFLLLLLVVCNSIHPSIKEIISFAQAQEQLQQADSESIVLFDVDEVLVASYDKIFWPKFYKNEPIKSLFRLHEPLFNHKLDHFWSIIVLQKRSHLIEADIIKLIEALYNQNCMVLALTKMRVGKCGLIESRQEFRFNELKNLGIDFRRSFEKNIIFTQHPCNFNEHPMIYNGIIFSNECSKGEVLGIFLDHLDFVPKRIFFFDDLLDNLLSVEQELAKRNIPFEGFHYCAADHFQGELSYEVAEFQINYLYEHESWINQEKAEEMLFKLKEQTRTRCNEKN